MKYTSAVLVSTPVRRNIGHNIMVFGISLVVPFGLRLCWHYCRYWQRLRSWYHHFLSRIKFSHDTEQLRQCLISSQCSTLVRITVVRAILQAYGKWWISTPGEPKLVNRLRWNLAWVIKSLTPPHRHKTKSVCKGGSFGGGVKYSTQACFSGFFWFPERTSSLPGKDWLGALCTQKRVSVVSWFLGGEIPKKVQRPHFRG